MTEDNSIKIPSFSTISESIGNAIIEHSMEEEHQPEGYDIGILDHINEYKNVKDYTLVC